jgi:DNA processing protein
MNEIETLVLSNNTQYLGSHANSALIKELYIKDLELIEHYDITLIPHDDPRYPRKLKEIPGAPSLLYVLGNANILKESSLAIIGTRNPSGHGKKTAFNFAKELAEKDLVIISGLAKGIDTEAHKGALNRTVAVLGSGLAHVYPEDNCSLANDICHLGGALVSEFPMHAAPERKNFPMRNRIVSGMSLGTLLIEAPLKSGSMITMEYSKKYRRKLFAISGQIDQENFRGNHELIKNNVACPVESCDDIILSLSDLFAGSLY